MRAGWWLAGSLALAAELPSTTFTEDQRGAIVSAPLDSGHPHNQPSVVDGLLLLAGNARHSLWDVADPTRPELVATFEGPHADGEAESHQVTQGRTADGRTVLTTISGKGVDLWDVTDPATPTLLAAVELDGIDYGDNTNAVWGVAWQGEALYVGGTNVGLFVLDVSDPEAPLLVGHLTSPELGGVSAGPLWALGDLLVVTSPKDHAGVATLDIADPFDPVLLDAELPDTKSYIGGFYGRFAHLISPWRTYDVLTDPSDITLLGSEPTEASEYVSFGDGHVFLGLLRPNPGVQKIAVSPYDGSLGVPWKIEGRRDDLSSGFFTDDQFSVPIGNLVVLSDDEIGIGSVIAVHDPTPDALPPTLLAARPAEGAVGVAPTARIGLSFSDQLDLRSVGPDSVVLRPLGGDPVPAVFGLTHTVLSVWPTDGLDVDTTYELVLPAGGVRDLGGNALAQEVRLTFATGAELVRLPCGLRPGLATAGAPTTIDADDAGPDATYTWDLGDGRDPVTTDDPQVTATWNAPGRPLVRLEVAAPAGRRACATTVPVHRAAVGAPAAASTLAVDADRAWVVVPDAGSVAVVDLGRGERIAEHAVGDTPRGVAVADDGSVWVTLHGEDAVVRLDPDGTVRTRTELPYGTAPWGVVAEPDGAWIAAEGSGAVLRLDADGALVATVPLLVGSDPTVRPRALALTPDGARLVVPRFTTVGDTAQVLLVDTAAQVVADVVSLGWDAGPDTNNDGAGVLNALGAVAVTADGELAAIVAKKDADHRGPARAGEVLDPDNTTRTVVAWIDLAAAVEDPARRVDLDDHALLQALAFSPGGDLLAVASVGSNQVDVLDVATGRRLAGAPTGIAPRGVAFAGDGRLVVDDEASRTLTVLDATGLVAGTDTALVPVATIPTVGVEPLAPAVLLGKQLFHNARSREMSQDGYIACASCHLDGADDGRTWDFTDRGEGLRNTTDLRGRRGTGHGRVHWTGNFDEIQDFENDLRLHFGGSGLLDDTDFEATADPLGAPKAGRSPRLDALAAYVASLDRYPRSPFRTADGGYTDEAKAGRRLLERLDCLTCHKGDDLTDSATGARHDVGTLRPTSGQRLGGPLDGLDTPTLHGVWATGPWLHDGSAATLDAALATPTHGDELTDVERTRLVALLRSLDGELPEVEPGCDGCRSAGGAPAWGFALAALAALRRRRAISSPTHRRLT